MEEKGINKRIRQLFEMNNAENKPYTSSSVSKATGIGRVTLDNYRSGSQKPSAYNASIIADYFGVSYEWLLAGRGEMYDKKSPEKGDDIKIPLDIVKMMHEERLRHYEENKILLEEIQKLSQTVQQQMDELKKMHAQKEDCAGCADAV